MYIHSQNPAHGYTAPAYHAGAYYARAPFISLLDAISMASFIIVSVIVGLLQFMTTS